MPAYILALIAFIFPSYAFAIDQMYNWNGLEFVTSGNTTHVHPSSPEATRLRGGWTLDISDVEPKATASHNLPYKNSSNPPAKLTVGWPISPQKVNSGAAKALEAGLAGVSTGNGYVAVASIACAFVCEPLIEGLVGWGIDQIKQNPDGSVSALAPDPNASLSNTSDGYIWHVPAVNFDFLSAAAACSYHGSYIAALSSGTFTSSSVSPPTCTYSFTRNGETQTMSNDVVTRHGSSGCPSGRAIVNGVCSSANAPSPTVEVPLTTYLQSNYTGKGWDHYWAGITAGLVAAGVNVFTDGTGTTITGPAVVPVSTSESKTPINLTPGTTNPAPTGTTGATDSGTQTTTTTTTAHNTYRPGSSGTGPSIQTKTQTTTTTNITNNITNTTSSTVTNNVTETDKAPEKEEKDFCEKNPDSLACAEMDTPEGEVPRDTINIEFNPEDLGLGNGSCPPDKPIDALTVFSYQPTCDILDSYVYPMVIAFATFGALLIIFVGKAEA